MAKATSETTETTSATLDAQPLRIVLFGVPKAGKSSLLGALGQIQKENPDLLQGELVDRQQGLERERALVYEEGAPRTEEEVLPVPVEFRPVRSGRKKASSPVQANLIDCDGHIAAEILVGHRPLRGKQAKGGLGPTLWDADSLVLVIDAADSEKRMEKVFKALGNFLLQLEQRRGEETEVTNLPVFLVLTKCDLLAEEGDGFSEWVDRMEDRKREVEDRFKAYLAEQQARRPKAFGRLDFNPWTTAIHRPALGRKEAKPGEPYGVAELFWQCFRRAYDYRQRRKKSTRRLFWTTGSTSGLAVLLSSLLVMLLAGLGISRQSRIQLELDAFRNSEGRTIEARLHTDLERLEEKQKILNGFLNDRNFDSLASESRDYVKKRLKELDAYIPYLKRIQEARSPTVAQNDRELQGRLAMLQKEPYTLPDPVWEGTGAAMLREQMLFDLRLLDKKVNALEKWLEDRRGRALELWTIPEPYRDGEFISWREWQPVAHRFLSKVSEPLPGTEDLPVRSMVTAYTILAFERIAKAKKSFEQGRARVEALLNISLALKLDPTADKPAPLVIPRNFQLADARELFAQLREHYPNYEQQMTLDNVPDIAWRSVRNAAAPAYATLLPQAQARVKKELMELAQGEKVTHTQWRAVARWLRKDPEPLQAWRELSLPLQRLSSELPSDPVTSLAEFLEKDVLRLYVDKVTLVVPIFSDARPVDQAAFTLVHQGKSIPFRSQGRRRSPTRSVWLYDYGTPGLIREIDYRPGEALTATLDARGGRQLTWTQARTETYAIESLQRYPLLHQKGEPARSGEPEKLDLTLLPVKNVPTVPDLLPELRK